MVDFRKVSAKQRQPQNSKPSKRVVHSLTLNSQSTLDHIHFGSKPNKIKNPTTVGQYSMWLSTTPAHMFLPPPTKKVFIVNTHADKSLHFPTAFVCCVRKQLSLHS